MKFTFVYGFTIVLVFYYNGWRNIYDLSVQECFLILSLILLGGLLDVLDRLEIIIKNIGRK